MSGPLAQRSIDLSINGLGLNASDTVGRSLARAFDFFFPDVELRHPLPFRMGTFDFITLSEAMFNHKRTAISIVENIRGLLKTPGFLVVSQASHAITEVNYSDAVNFVETCHEAGFEFVEEVPIIPTLGVPAIPNPDLWIAHSR